MLLHLSLRERRSGSVDPVVPGASWPPTTPADIHRICTLSVMRGAAAVRPALWRESVGRRSRAPIGAGAQHSQRRQGRRGQTRRFEPSVRDCLAARSRSRSAPGSYSPEKRRCHHPLRAGRDGSSGAAGARRAARGRARAPWTAGVSSRVRLARGEARLRRRSARRAPPGRLRRAARSGGCVPRAALGRLARCERAPAAPRLRRCRPGSRRMLPARGSRIRSWASACRRFALMRPRISRWARRPDARAARRPGRAATAAPAAAPAPASAADPRDRCRRGRCMAARRVRPALDRLLGKVLAGLGLVCVCGRPGSCPRCPRRCGADATAPARRRDAHDGVADRHRRARRACRAGAGVADGVRSPPRSGASSVSSATSLVARPPGARSPIPC